MRVRSLGSPYFTGVAALAFVVAFWILLPPVSGAGETDSDTATGTRTRISDVPWVPEAIAGDDKVVYGSDDRIDVYQESNADRIDWAESTCALVDSYQLMENFDGSFDLASSAYRQGGYVPCAGEPFANQPTAAWCSGFMVDDDVIVTAGHCIDAGELPYVRFVFGFDMQNATTPVLNFDADQVYMGVEIIARSLAGDYDFAVVRVDRPITVANALPLRREGSIAVGTRVGVIGHPSGLPKKIAFGANTQVRANSSPGYFMANLDTYGGNSGSPVFNADNGFVEGILVRGNADFVFEAGCFRSNVLPDATINSEDVSKSTTFAGYVNQAPENDDCADAMTISAGQTKTGSTGDATGSDVTSCGSNDSADVWFSFTPAAGNHYEISLCGSDFDTTLAVYEGGCSNPTETECNDDSCGSQSELCLYMDSGFTRLIRVAGNGGATGNYRLKITQVVSCGAVEGEGEEEGEEEDEGEVEGESLSPGLTITSCTINPNPVTSGEIVTLSAMKGQCRTAVHSQTVRLTAGFRDASGAWVGGDPVVVWGGEPGTEMQQWTSPDGKSVVAPAVPGNYSVWVRSTATQQNSVAIQDFKDAVPTSADEERDDRWSAPLVVEEPVIEGELPEGESPSYGVTVTSCSMTPNPVGPGQVVALGELKGEYHGGTASEMLKVTVGFRNARGVWMGGDPVVVQSGGPDTAPLVWSSSVTISAPVPEETYYVWVHVTPTTSNLEAVEDFKAAIPMSADENEDDKWDIPLTVAHTYGVRVTSCTISPNPAAPNAALGLSGLGGKYHGAGASDTIKVTVGLRDAAGAWAGGDPVVIKSGIPGTTWASWSGSATVAAPASAGTYYVWVRNTATMSDSEAVQDFKDAVVPGEDETRNDKWGTQVLVRTAPVEGEPDEGEPAEGEAEGEGLWEGEFTEGEVVEGEREGEPGGEGEPACCGSGPGGNKDFFTPEGILRRLGDLLILGAAIAALLGLNSIRGSA